VRRVDAGAIGAAALRILRGANTVASNAIAFNKVGYVARRALVNGAPGVVTFADGNPVAVLGFTVAGGKIVEMNVLADRVRLRQLGLTVLAR
jgi:hypothetical protein